MTDYTTDLSARLRAEDHDWRTEVGEFPILREAADRIEEQQRTITEQESLIEAQQDTLAAWTFMHSTLIGASAAVGVHEAYRVLAQGLLELIPDDRLQSERIDAMMAVLRANRGKLR